MDSLDVSSICTEINSGHGILNYLVDTSNKVACCLGEAEQANGVCLHVELRMDFNKGMSGSAIRTYEGISVCIGGVSHRDIVDCTTFQIENDKPRRSVFVRRFQIVEQVLNTSLWNQVLRFERETLRVEWARLYGDPVSICIHYRISLLTMPPMSLSASVSAQLVTAPSQLSRV